MQTVSKHKRANMNEQTQMRVFKRKWVNANEGGWVNVNKSGQTGAGEREQANKSRPTGAGEWERAIKSRPSRVGECEQGQVSVNEGGGAMVAAAATVGSPLPPFFSLFI